MNATAKHVVLFLVLGTAVSVIGWYGWLWYSAGRFIEKTDDAYVQADVIDIRPEVTARIARVLVHDNQAVHAGQPLVTLDAADFRARNDQAQAQLAQIRAALTETGARIDLQLKKIDEAQAGVSAAEAEVRRTRLELTRARDLARRSYGSKQRLQNAEAAAETAVAKQRQAEAALAARRQMLAVLRANRDSAEAQVQTARAEADYARHQLSKTTLVAPRDGVVGDLHARVGAIAQPAVTLLRVVPIPDLYVTANFKETQIGRMSIGQAATIHVDAFPQVTFRGRVESLAPATGTEFSLLPQDNATGNFNKIVQRVPVRIRITGPSAELARLRPGLSAVPAVDTAHAGTRLSYVDDLYGSERSRLARQ